MFKRCILENCSKLLDLPTLQLDKYKRVVAGGSAHMVTPGGYTLGGGHGPLSPSIGLAVDNLLEIQVRQRLMFDLLLAFRRFYSTGVFIR